MRDDLLAEKYIENYKKASLFSQIGGNKLAFCFGCQEQTNLCKLQPLSHKYCCKYHIKQNKQLHLNRQHHHS